MTKSLSSIEQLTAPDVDSIMKAIKYRHLQIQEPLENNPLRQSRTISLVRNNIWGFHENRITPLPPIASQYTNESLFAYHIHGKICSFSRINREITPFNTKPKAKMIGVKVSVRAALSSDNSW